MQFSFRIVDLYIVNRALLLILFSGHFYSSHSLRKRDFECLCVTIGRQRSNRGPEVRTN